MDIDTIKKIDRLMVKAKEEFETFIKNGLKETDVESIRIGHYIDDTLIPDIDFFKDGRWKNLSYYHTKEAKIIEELIDSIDSDLICSLVLYFGDWIVIEND